MREPFGPLVLGVFTGIVLAQAQAPPPERFEVASIKPVASSGEVIQFRFHHGGIVARNVTLAFLIETAYPGLRGDDAILNAPKWAFSDTFDVDAKPAAAEPDVLDPTRTTEDNNRSAARIQARLRTLLEERFQLQLHRETRPIRGYALEVGKTGAKFLDSKLPEGQPGGRISQLGPGRITAKSLTMAALANRLGNALHEPVADKTGLSGFFAFDLSWTPDPPPADPGRETAPVPEPAAGPSLFTAIQEQLGLRLVRNVQERPVLVVERVGKPAAN